MPAHASDDALRSAATIRSSVLSVVPSQGTFDVSMMVTVPTVGRPSCMVTVMPGCRCLQRAGDSGPRRTDPVAAGGIAGADSTQMRATSKSGSSAAVRLPISHSGRRMPLPGTGVCRLLRRATGVATRHGRSRGCSPTDPSGTMRRHQRAPSSRRCRSADPTKRPAVANPCRGPQGGRVRPPTLRGRGYSRTYTLVTSASLTTSAGTMAAARASRSATSTCGLFNAAAASALRLSPALGPAAPCDSPRAVRSRACPADLVGVGR